MIVGMERAATATIPFQVEVRTTWNSTDQVPAGITDHGVVQAREHDVLRRHVPAVAETDERDQSLSVLLPIRPARTSWLPSERSGLHRMP